MTIVVSDPNIIQKLNKGLNFNPIFSEGKKIQTSFIWMGKKNAGKTKKLLDTFRGPMLIFSFDNQTEIIVSEKIKQEKKKYGKSRTEENVVVANFFPAEYRHIKGSGDDRRLEVGYQIIKDVEKMLDNIRANNLHFDYIVADGYPELKDRINEYMRKMAGLTLTEQILGGDLTAYGHRNRFFQLFVSSLFELSDICPIVTTYPKVDLSKAFKGNPPPEPEMDKNLMWEFRNIVWLERTIEEDRHKKQVIQFYANLQAMKGVDFGEEGTTINVTGDTPVFPIEKLEAYRKGNPLNNVEQKKVTIDLSGDDEEQQIPEAKSEKSSENPVESIPAEEKKPVAEESFLDSL